MLTRILNFQGSFTFNGGYVSKVKDVESKPAILCRLYHLLNIQKIIMWIKVIKKKQTQIQTTYSLPSLCRTVLCDIVYQRLYSVRYLQYHNQKGLCGCFYSVLE